MSCVSDDGFMKVVVFRQRGQVLMLVRPDVNIHHCRFSSPDGLILRTQNRFACEKAICKMPVIHTNRLEEISMLKGV